MLEIINFFSTLDDLLIVGGVVLVAFGHFEIGIFCVVSGLAIMAGKGEILIPIR